VAQGFACLRYGLVRPHTWAILLLVGSLAGACSAQPTGSAAHLYESRPDEKATALTATNLIDIKPAVSDLDDFDREAASVPEEAIVSNEEALDDTTTFIATQYRLMREIVHQHQRILENFRDVGSFLNANFSSSEAEIRGAIRTFDAQHPNAPIGPRLADFQAAETAIFEKNRELTKAVMTIASKSLSPIDWFSTATMGVTVVLDEAVMLPNRLLGLIFCPHCTPVDNGTIEICRNGNCVKRTIEEQRRIETNALERAGDQRQMTVNAYVYIRYIEDKLNLIRSLDGAS
jgi:hypothetical protein